MVGPDVQMYGEFSGLKTQNGGGITVQIDQGAQYPAEIILGGRSLRNLCVRSFRTQRGLALYQGHDDESGGSEIYAEDNFQVVYYAG